ncbi:alpha/beta fold hydrolase [Pigmentibacter sp. JX0631]|uniref:alpha/beta hydrolase n=1 Tax=Pigmentibacter sp. JX0631 TaxID=2976982 RepID=UPI002469612D|nr:alpha/beta fold hydrolase [Pigmentibacter sp. JX0631]WGL59719.1 alpha/beta fold hydrolase [Pigmentibacter sp. JX0631]
MKLTKHRFFKLLLLITISQFFGCNHLFYYPDKTIRFEPSKLELPFENIYINVDSSTKLNGWLIKSKRKENLGLVVQFHGNAENISTHFLYLSWLTEYGYDVFIFDYRGYGLSNGNPEREMIFKDSIQVLNWIFSNYTYKNIFLVGQSLGGAILIPVIGENPNEKIRGIVLDSTFSSYRSITRDKLSSVWLTWPLQWPLSFLVSDEYSPIDFANKITVPILNFHSENDPVVSYELGKALYEAIPSQKEMNTLSGKEHCAAFIMKEDQYRRKLLEFFCMNILEKNNQCAKELEDLKNIRIKNAIDIYNEKKNQKG